jgi:Papain-like cysteine protease AvrRpt2
MSTSPINFNVPAPTTPQSDVNNSSAGGSSNVDNTATGSSNTQLAPTAKSLADISADFHPDQYAQTNVQTNAGNEIALNIPAGGNGAASDNSYSLASASGSNANQASAAKPQDVALSLQAAKPKFVDIEIKEGWLGEKTFSGKEIVNSKWYSESTNSATEKWSELQFPNYRDTNKGRELIEVGRFQQLGCHATGILNAANTISSRVSGETATPRNARDYQVTSLDEKLKTKVVNNVDVKDNAYTGNKFLNVIKNVQFYDLNASERFTKISQDKLFEVSKKSFNISDTTMQRIKDNVNVGNPVTIGIAAKGGQVRHTAVISGIVKDKEGNEQLMVRDNWRDKDGQAEMLTLDQFASKYQWGTNAKTVQVDMVWAAAAKNK